jgi:TraM recognition site of TraD and TraG
LPSGLTVGLELLLAFIASLIGWAILIAFIWAVRVALAGFLYYMEDTTTGFLKVRERVQAANREAAWLLENHTTVDVFGEHSLTLGATESSGYSQPLVIPGDYRTTHMYVVGASGAGKSSLLKNLILQDLKSQMGLCVIDPHGDLVSDTIPFLGERTGQTILLDLADTEHMLGYNPLERKPGVLVAEQVSKLLLAFKRVWEDSWGPRMEDILRHTLALLIENGYTLREYERVLTDADFRAMLLEQTETEQTLEFFHGRYNTWNSKERSIFNESSLNKVSAFLADPRIGFRLGQAKSGFTIREVMDTGGVLLVNLAKGRLGGGADLFGALLMADIETSFLTRAPGLRKPFALYTDEFQNIATDSFATVLTEARKFGLCLTMAHQSLKQLDDKLVALILGNAQTQVYFRVSRQDAERLAKESANIVEQLESREEHLLQEPVNKFTLQEMWEVAFHSLARLQPREAYVMVKGAMEHPAQIRTLDNLTAKPRGFEFTETYSTLDALSAALKARNADIRAKIEAYLQRLNEERKKRKPSNAPPDAEPPVLDLPPDD